jgi:hypothetical protein
MEILTSVARLPLNERKLRCQLGFEEHTFSYDDKYVTIESKNGLNSGIKKYDLWRLIPTPATEQMVRPEASSQTRSGIGFLLAGIIVFFSEFRWSLPLFVPVLTLVGVTELGIGWFRLRPRTFTHFFGSDGPAMVSIPMKINEGNREAFIHGLSEAIRSARTAVYGTTSV